MSEALNKYIKSKAKTASAFDKKFGGSDGALSLMQVIGDAPKSVVKQAQKILESNPDDIEVSARQIRDMVFGASEPKKGVRGKTADTGERIEGNLPTNDKGVVADPPKSKGKATAEDESLATARQSQAFQAEREAAARAAREPRGKRKADARKELEDAQAERSADDEMSTSIGQFVPAPDLSGVNVAGSFLPGAFDPRVQVEIGGAAPTFSVDTDPASLRRANPFDVGRLSDPRFAAPDVEPSVASDAPPASMPVTGAPSRADRIMAGLLDDAPQADAAPAPSRADLLMAGLLDDAPTEGSPFGPYRDGLFDMNSGTDVEPPSNPSLPGAISPDGGFLGVDQTPPMFNADGGFMGGEYGPTQINNEGGFMGGEYGPPRSMAPPQKRPPFYDPNRSFRQWWNEPGLVSKANEFLYQRGMPAGMARAIQPTASAVDKTAKVVAPAIVGGVTGYAALEGLRALGSMGQDSAGAPPSDEQMSALSDELQAAENSVRAMMQPPRKNPASAQPSTPVQ